MANPDFVSDDEWGRRATDAAIQAARAIAQGESINARSQIGSLSDIEWGWIICAAIFGWIGNKAKQAVDAGASVDGTILMMTGTAPDPWEAGAIETILPQLGNIPNVDWSKPVDDWTKEQVVSFAWHIYKLSDTALARRDEGARNIIPFNQERAERNISAQNGGPLMSRSELSTLVDDYRV